MALRFDITRVCPPLVWWLYDQVIADRVDGLSAAFIEELADVMPNESAILDVGCGGGQFAIALARRNPQWCVVGVDVDSGQVRRASRRARAQSHPVRFQQASAEDLPFRSESFDAVVSVGSLKHWAVPQLGMAEMTRVLRSGGQLRVVEASLGCSLADSRKTVECLRYPRLLQGVGAHFFRTCVAGAAISVDEAGDLTQDLQLEGVTVGLIAEAPAFWRIAARKLPACSKSVV